MSIFKQLKVPEAFNLNINKLLKGIDNYHVDIRLSKWFCAEVKTLATELLRRETENVQPNTNIETNFNLVSKSYVDMMNVLIHRIKTDLSTNEINFLQFAVAKYVLESVSQTLDDYLTELSEKASLLHARGSMDSGTSQNQQAWLRKHRASVAYRINRQIFDKLQEAETKHLHSVRSHYLGSDEIDFSSFLSCPTLLHRNIESAEFLIENYVFWGNESGHSDFTAFNKEVENLLSNLVPELDIIKLMSRADETSQAPEKFDTLNGFLDLEPYLGAALDTKDALSEQFCWLESAANVDYIFDIERHKNNGIDRSETKKLEKIFDKFSHLLKKKKLFPLFVASIEMHNVWSYGICRDIDQHLVCRYLAGQIKLSKLEDPALGGRILADDEKRLLKKSMSEVSRSIRKHRNVNLAVIITSLSRFRMHLKYARFAHCIFNRMALLNKSNDIQLSKQAGTLYQLPCKGEIEEEEAKISHHAILKADIRGSTVATEMLEKKTLNPASHFSLHFFNPIKDVLPQYGGSQVFLEGDAVIIGFLEYENNPEEWYSVARACGLSKAILKIIATHNEYSRQKGLPVLELGIGICFSPESPRYLFDSGKAVMISSAIGQADRLSSCSWQLLEKLQNHEFNVEVLEIAENQKELGEKGRDILQYNVNGILLQYEAFVKLREEVKLHQLTLSIAGRNEIFYCGVYTDVQGNYQDLVVREGRTGVWQNDTIQAGVASSRPYYEVIADDEILNLLFEAIERSNM